MRTNYSAQINTMGIATSAGTMTVVAGLAAIFTGGIVLIILGVYLAHLRIKKGDMGWDEDGNFVAGDLVFNFRTRQIFTGLMTIDASSIKDVGSSLFKVGFLLHGRKRFLKINVGETDRVAQALEKTYMMMNGATPVIPADESILPTYTVRKRLVRAKTVIRFLMRSFLLTAAWMIPYAMTHTYIWHRYGTLIAIASMGAIFGLSVLHRKKRTLKLPDWERSEHAGAMGDISRNALAHA